VHGHDWLARSFLQLKAASRAAFVMSLHYYTLSCAKKSLMYRGSPCTGPALSKCLVCAADHYGQAKGIAVALSNWRLSAAERAAVDMFLPVSQATAVGNGLSDGDRYVIVPNFMPDDRVESTATERYTAQLPDEPFLLFVGDLRRDKGVDVLLSAYAGLAGAPPLVLIGKAWSETPASFPPNVMVFRDWPNEAVLAAWKRSLMALVPSVWPEPFGLVVIEAMASGRPVIASRIGGIPDIVGDSGAGLLVPPGDPAALRLSIERLLGDPGLRAAMGLAARRRAGSFRAAAVVPKIEQVYAAVLRQRPEQNETTTSSQHRYQQL
jgi:glycosyltransferase involved in cell wall biosynthesis